MTMPAAKTRRKPATEADLLALPEQWRGYELLDGALVEKQAGFRHGRAQVRLGQRLSPRRLSRAQPPRALPMRKPTSLLAAVTAATLTLALTAPEARGDDAKAPSTVQKLAPEPAPVDRWWTVKSLVPEAVTTGVTLGVLIGVSVGATPTNTAFIGPSFDASNPRAILAPKYASSLGHTYAESETVPIGAAITLSLASATVVIGASILDAVAEEKSRPDIRGAYVYDMVGGYADAALFTLLTTEVFKNAFGRLRPDFQARVRYFYCNEPSSPLSSSQCAGVPADEGHKNFAKKEVIKDGRSSFPSGHSSFSFATAMYGVLVLGGEFQWGDHASPGLGLAALAAQGTMLGTATWIAASRVADGRHNVSDILTGGAIGVAWANVAYWRRFDTHGRPRRLAPKRALGTGINVDVIPMPGGIGLTGTF